MKAALLNELALLARTEADAILQLYAWPPRAPLSAEEKAEHARLVVTALAIGYRADVAAYEERSGSVRLRAARWFRSLDSTPCSVCARPWLRHSREERGACLAEWGYP